MHTSSTKVEFVLMLSLEHSASLQSMGISAVGTLSTDDRHVLMPGRRPSILPPYSSLLPIHLLPVHLHNFPPDLRSIFCFLRFATAEEDQASLKRPQASYSAVIHISIVSGASPPRNVKRSPATPSFCVGRPRLHSFRVDNSNPQTYRSMRGAGSSLPPPYNSVYIM